MRGRNRTYRLKYLWLVMVGAEGFEPPTLCSQSRCATRLRYAPISSSDCNPIRLRSISLDALREAPPGLAADTLLTRRIWIIPRQICSLSAHPRRIRFDATIDGVDGGYSSAAERLTVAQDVVGSIPTSRPNAPS
jgi:hypothetical protein